MKDFKIMLLQAAFATALSVSRVCQAQFNPALSSYNFSNGPFGLDAPVFDGSGNRLSGANYVAVLYGGPTQDGLQLAANFITLAPMAPVPFTYMPTGTAGYFFGGGVSVYSMTCGGLAWLQVRAWDARLGGSYDDVVKLGLGGYGESNLFQAPGGAPYPCLINPTPAKGLFGLQSFSLLPEVPEPNSLLLLLVGLPLLLVRRGRRE